MRNASVLVQIALFIIGVVVIWMYVYPAFTEISRDQDQISEYDEAIAQATEVNTLLDGLLQEIEAIPEEDQERLNTYLPTEVDQIVVQRDLLAYVERRDLALESLRQDQEIEAVEDTDRSGETFNLTVIGAYDEIKDMLLDIEQHHYPLHIENIRMERTEQNDIRADITFMTYAFSSNDF